MLACILQEDRNFLSPFQDDNDSLPIVQTAWKKYLVIAIDFMNNIEKMNIPLVSIFKRNRYYKLNIFMKSP